MSKKKPLRGAGILGHYPHGTTSQRCQECARSWPFRCRNEGIKILEYDVKEGAEHRVSSGRYDESFMQRVGPAPDGDMFIDATAGNKQPLW